MNVFIQVSSQVFVVSKLAYLKTCLLNYDLCMSALINIYRIQFYYSLTDSLTHSHTH